MGYLKAALITLCDNCPKKWDTHLSAVLLAYTDRCHTLKQGKRPSS